MRVPKCVEVGRRGFKFAVANWTLNCSRPQVHYIHSFSISLRSKRTLHKVFFFFLFVFWITLLLPATSQADRRVRSCAAGNYFSFYFPPSKCKMRHKVKRCFECPRQKSVGEIDGKPEPVDLITSGFVSSIFTLKSPPSTRGCDQYSQVIPKCTGTDGKQGSAQNMLSYNVNRGAC